MFFINYCMNIATSVVTLGSRGHGFDPWGALGTSRPYIALSARPPKTSQNSLHLKLLHKKKITRVVRQIVSKRNNVQSGPALSSWKYIYLYFFIQSVSLLKYSSLTI